MDKAVSVWVASLLLSMLVPLFIFSSLFIPPTPLLLGDIWPTSAQLIYAQQMQTFIPLHPPSARKFECNQTFNRQGTPAGLSIKSMHTQAFSNTYKHTHRVDYLKLMIPAAAAENEEIKSIQKKRNVITAKYSELCNKYI